MKRILALAVALCLLCCTCAVAVSGADKVYALTMGVHRYAANNTVTDGSGVASVTYFRHKDGTSGSANHIYNVESGERFTLTTAVKEGQENNFSFLCWLDMDGVVIGRETTLELTIDSSKAAFAVYVENADRHLLTYKVVGEGKVSVFSDLPVFQGDDCVSLLHGARAEIHFTPAKAYTAYYLKVNGQKVSFFANAFDAFDSALKARAFRDAFGALLNMAKFVIGLEAVYTISPIEADVTFEVGFMKSALAYTSALLN